MIERSIPPAPVHVLSAMVVLALDWVWMVFEGLVSMTILGLIALPILSLSVGAVAFMAVYSIQYFIARDGGGQAFAKAAGMAVLAAVPFPVVGTAIGVPLLAWAGLHQLERGGNDAR